MAEHTDEAAARRLLKDSREGVKNAADKSAAARSVSPTDKIEVRISSSRYPESAGHILDAQNAGQPANLTIDRASAAARRRESLSGQKGVPGKDRDEYPPAMFQEGGQGASVRPISPGDNRGAGACIGSQCRGLPEGTQVILKVKP